MTSTFHCSQYINRLSRVVCKHATRTRCWPLRNHLRMDDAQLPIETFVFLDLEATGLQSPGSRPRIAELSMVAINRHLLQAPCMRDEPRVLNKITLCVYPRKPMELGASDITKLYTEDLHWQKELDENFVASVELFLARLGPPVCVVAHNGNKFDFPLLRSELGMLNKALRDDILCVDSLVMCRDLDNVNPVDAVRVLMDQKTCRKSLNFESNTSKYDENIPETNGRHIPQATPSKVDVVDQSDTSEVVLDPRSAQLKPSSLQPAQGDAEIIRNPKKKQKTSHEICRRLLYNDSSTASIQAEDNSCNELDSQQSFSIINPGNMPRLEDSKSSNNMAVNGNSMCESNLSTEKTPTPTEITSNNNTQRSSTRPDSESDTDTIPVIGDTESETMSTLQQMSTFRYDQSFSSSASTVDLGRMVSVGVAPLDSQGTEVYSIDDPMPFDSQSSLPNSISILDQQMNSCGSPESISDEDLLLADVDLDLQNTAVGSSQVSVSDSTLGNLTLESQLSHAGPPDMHQGPSCVQTGEKENDRKIDLCENSTSLPSSRSAQRPSTELLPQDSPANRTNPAEVLQEIARLGTHAPKKQPRTKQKQTVSYQLSELHRRILGYEPPRSHCAEDDAMALLRIFHRKAQDVVAWSDTHAVPLNSIPFMYPLQQNTCTADIAPTGNT